VNIQSNQQLEDQITTLAGQINPANYRFLKLIAEFDRRQAWSGYGYKLEVWPINESSSREG
jgi:hypothetical protein